MLRAGRFAAALLVGVLTCRSGAALASGNPDLEQRLITVVRSYDAQKYAAVLSGAQTGVAVARTEHSVPYLAKFLVFVGLAQEALGHHEEALKADTESLALYHSLADTAGEALDLADLGTVYYALGSLDEAQASDGLALALDRARGDRIGEAQEYGELGSVDDARGRYGEGLADHERALALDRAVADREGEAQQLGDIGLVLGEMGRYTDALSSYRVSLELARKLKKRKTEAAALGGIGQVLDTLGSYDEALASEGQALEIDLALGTPAGAAQELNAMGNAYVSLRRYPDALSSYRDALKLERLLEDPRGEAADLANIGAVDFLLGQASEARSQYEQAVTIAHASGDLPSEAEDRSDLGNVLFDLGRYEEALAAHAEAIALKRSFDAPDIWRSFAGLAGDEAKLGRTDAAVTDFDNAVGKIEALRSDLHVESDRRTFFSTALGVYDAYIEYLLTLQSRFPDRHYDRKALQVFEHEQARAFLEEIGKSAARRFAGVPPDVVAREAEFAAGIERDEENLLKARIAPSVNETAMDELEKDRAGLLVRAAALERSIAAAYPAYYALTHPTPIDPGALQRLLGPGVSMLVYAVLQDTTALWVVDAGNVHLYDLAIGSDELTKRVEAFRKGPDSMQDAIDQHTPAIGLVRIATDGMPDFERASFTLYTALMPPKVQTAISEAHALIVVPTGPLYSVPWEALVTQMPADGADPHYLIQDRAVSYLTSGSLLGILRDAESHRGTPAPDPLLAFANPNFTATTTATAGGTGTTLQARSLAAVVSRGQPGASGFPELPGTAAEVEAVEATLGAPAASHPLYENDDASRTNVMHLNDADCAKEPCLRDYRYVVFATHAVLPDQVSGLTQPALVLAHPDHDGFLTMADVLDLTLDADFVSLSACNTGGGTATRGDGVRGLTQAFMYAGAPAVSVTLWDFADAAGQQLTPAFYAGLKAGKSPADALRDAKLQMLGGGNPLFLHPFFWAPTVIFGDGTAAPK